MTDQPIIARRVLLLASYCGDDDPECTDDLPCLDCLRSCNTVIITGPLTDNRGSYDFQREQRHGKAQKAKRP